MVIKKTQGSQGCEGKHRRIPDGESKRKCSGASKALL
jgi:hypothetical protein